MSTAALSTVSGPRVCRKCGEDGAGFVCGQCLSAFYCSSKCQIEDWKERHNGDCDPSLKEARRRQRSAQGSPSVATPRRKVCGSCGAEDAQYICTRCMGVNYCSESCQHADWKAHKRTCVPKNLRSPHAKAVEAATNTDAERAAAARQEEEEEEARQRAMREREEEKEKRREEEQRERERKAREAREQHDKNKGNGNDSNSNNSKNGDREAEREHRDRIERERERAETERQIEMQRSRESEMRDRERDARRRAEESRLDDQERQRRERYESERAAARLLEKSLVEKANENGEEIVLTPRGRKHLRRGPGHPIHPDGWIAPDDDDHREGHGSYGGSYASSPTARRVNVNLGAAADGMRSPPVDLAGYVPAVSEALDGYTREKHAYFSESRLSGGEAHHRHGSPGRRNPRVRNQLHLHTVSSAMRTLGPSTEVATTPVGSKKTKPRTGRRSGGNRSAGTASSHPANVTRKPRPASMSDPATRARVREDVTLLLRAMRSDTSRLAKRCVEDVALDGQDPDLLRNLDADVRAARVAVLEVQNALRALADTMDCTFDADPAEMA